jgi:hypothetical protein
MKNKQVCLAVFAACAWLPAAHAQLEVGGGLLDSCSQIDSLRKSGDVTGAHAKAQACLQGLEQELQSQVGGAFPTEVAGWKRTNVEQNQALGFTNVSATYEKGDTSAIVSLTGGAGGSGGGASLGGLLGGIARLGLQSGQQVRVGGLPASVQADGTIAVTLENGSFLTFMSTSFDDQESALAGLGELVNGFPVADINQML